MENEKIECEKIAKIEELSRPLNTFINEHLPQECKKAFNAWTRLQECVNWAINAALDEEIRKRAEQK